MKKILSNISSISFTAFENSGSTLSSMSLVIVCDSSFFSKLESCFNLSTLFDALLNPANGSITQLKLFLVYLI